MKQNANAIYDAGNYMDVFEQDIVEAQKKIIVSSPELTRDKVDRFVYLIKARQEAGCDITVIATDPDNILYGCPDYYQALLAEMRAAGINVIVKSEVAEHFAIMDDDLVWHGGMNLLGKEDIWDNLMRINSPQVAAELLELSLGNNT